MAREITAASLKALEKEVLNMSEELGKLTRAYFAGLVATGIVSPKPPRPTVGRRALYLRLDAHPGS